MRMRHSVADVVDLRFVSEACGGDVGMMRELLDIFVDQASCLEDNMSEALAQGDYLALAAQAHKFKSTALSMGMAETADALKKIEIVAKRLAAGRMGGGVSVPVKGLSPALDEWANRNLSDEALRELIDFCKLQSLSAVQEVNRLLHSLLQ